MLLPLLPETTTTTMWTIPVSFAHLKDRYQLGYHFTLNFFLFSAAAADLYRSSSAFRCKTIPQNRRACGETRAGSPKTGYSRAGYSRKRARDRTRPEPGNRARQNPEPGSGPGQNPGTEPATGPGQNPGTEPGTGSGRNLGTNPEPGQDPKPAPGQPDPNKPDPNTPKQPDNPDDQSGLPNGSDDPEVPICKRVGDCETDSGSKAINHQNREGPDISYDAKFKAH